RVLLAPSAIGGQGLHPDYPGGLVQHGRHRAGYFQGHQFFTGDASRGVSARKSPPPTGASRDGAVVPFDAARSARAPFSQFAWAVKTNETTSRTERTGANVNSETLSAAHIEEIAAQKTLKVRSRPRSRHFPAERFTFYLYRLVERYSRTFSAELPTALTADRSSAGV